jgi:hypothetical protein
MTMSDVPTTDVPEPTPAPAAADTPAPAGTILTGGTDDVADADPAAPSSPALPDFGWREGEREEWAGKDDKLLGQLKRFASPKNVFKSYVELRQKVSAGQLKAALPDNPSEDEVAAYRAAIGVPDDPAEYGLAFPEGTTPDEAQVAELNSWATAMNRAHAPPQFVKAAFSEYMRIAAENAQKQYESAQERRVQQIAEIRSEYGRDYQKNVNIANRFASTHLGDNAPELMSAKLADGTFLGDNPTFVRLLVNAGLATEGDVGMILAESAGGGKSIDDQYEEALALRQTDSSKYYSKEHQDKLMKLKTAQIARRQQGRAA